MQLLKFETPFGKWFWRPYMAGIVWWACSDKQAHSSCSLVERETLNTSKWPINVYLQIAARVLA